ncbi:MAG: carbon starvation CstA family protein [Candidatus Eisenbacteria bacterium]|nr:carbon starvation CstA family protein [Candidatus Eisenbacteria bacterium]
MTLPLLAVVVLTVLVVGYRLYGRLVARQFGLNDRRETPAVRHNDGRDFIPTRPFYLLSQHFAAIAAAGPIAGPILACQSFGWLPCILWITIGVIFIGGVHDLSALVASVRHDARSVAEIVRENIGRRAWISIMLFIWIALIYVIVAFVDITANTFLGRIEELNGVAIDFNRGGAVAGASIFYLFLSIVMGLVQHRFAPPLWLVTLIFVPATLGVVWIGTRFDSLMVLPAIPYLSPGKAWGLIILGYCFVASLLPMWLLLQPRGYLGGFVLYLALAAGVIGIFFGGFPIQQESFKTWNAPGETGSLFPFLFVTIACGACSGFHGLVCSGTTSRQIASESHCQPVGYGAMLLEAFVALIALSTVMIVSQATITAGRLAPGTIYGNGIGDYLCVVIGKQHRLIAITFGAMAFSTFVFDTLDVATRLGRYIIQELFGWARNAGALAATGLMVAIPALILMTAEPGAYLKFWILFGTSNQLLAALTLLSVTVWLHRNRKPVWFTLPPMVFVMTITLWSLFKQVTGPIESIRTHGLRPDITLMNGVISMALTLLAVSLLVEAVLAVRRGRRTD